MNCNIPGQNLKLFAKALHALARIGDDLFLQATKEEFKLITLNLRKTAYVQYKFSDVFFSSYEVDENKFNSKGNSVSCKIQLKTLLPLFKGSHLDKKLDYIKIQYDCDDFIVFKMKYKVDEISMIHKLRLMETEILSTDIAPDSGCNNISTSSTFCNQLLNMFSNYDDEITFEVTKDKTLVRNYCLGAPVSSKFVRSQINLNGSEFTTFRIDTETSINFSLKPFRTAIQFAEAFNLTINLNFQKGGKPLSISMKNPTFEVFYVVSTLNPSSDNQSTGSTAIPAKITQISNANLTLADQEAILNEDWDDFNLEGDKEKEQQLPIKRSTNNEKSQPGFCEIAEQAKSTRTNGVNSDKSQNSTKSKRIRDTESPTDFQDNRLLSPPESPRTKRAKLVFGRCFESTFVENALGAVLAPNSDSE